MIQKLNLENIIALNRKTYIDKTKSFRIHEEITREEQKRLAVICLRNHCINAARFLCNDEKLFNIKSLDELDFLSEGEKKVFL